MDALQAQHVDPAEVFKSDEEIEQLLEQQQQAAQEGPADPRIMAAQIRAQTDMQRVQAQNQGDLAELQTRLQIATMNQNMRREELQMTREIEMLKMSNQQNISLETIKAKLAETAIKEHGKKELYAEKEQLLFAMDEKSHEADLTEKGRAEAIEAGRLMKAEGLTFDLAYTSVLTRAIRTSWMALDEMGLLWIPVERSWRLNERHYGALQGKDKKQTSDEFGIEQVKVWRRAYAVPPPPLALDDPGHPRFDPRYAHLPADVLPASECLADVVVRMLPYWYDGIVPDLVAGHTTLVTAHGNSLRALVKHLDGISDDEITELNIPTGQPLVYEFDAAMSVTSRRYLDPEAAAVVEAMLESLLRELRAGRL